MMEGIKILSVEEVVNKTQFNLEIALIAAVVFSIVFIIIGIFISIKEHDWHNLLLIFGAGLFVSLFLATIAGTAFEKPVEYATQYKVIVSNEVPFVDFYEKYEVIEQDGEIFTIREKLQQGE